MHDAAGLREQGMEPAVERPGGEIRGVGLLHGGMVFSIEQEEFRSLDHGKMPPARVHQKLLAVIRNCEAEVIRDRLMPVVNGGQPKCCRKVNTQLPFV